MSMAKRKFIPASKRRAFGGGKAIGQGVASSSENGSISMGNVTTTGVAVHGHAATGGDLILSEPITVVIMLITAIIGLVTGTISIVSAVVGALTQPRKPSHDVGEAWTLWLSTGHNGARNPDGGPLTGAAGPFPEAQIFGQTGEFIGSSFEETGYAQHGSWNAMPVWPQDKDHRQKPEYVLLSFTRQGDPLCVVELGISQDASQRSLPGPCVADSFTISVFLWTISTETKGFQDDRAPSAHSGFNALTAQTCGYEWYHSGTKRFNENGDDEHMPCFWLGEKYTKSAQFHLPSHSLVNDPHRIKKINTSTETRHEYFCNSPAKMNFWHDAPSMEHMKARLNTEIDSTGPITLNQTLEKTKGKKNPGKPDPHHLARRAIHEDTISIARNNRPGLLANELCSMGNSWGPDWVNEKEGKFCRMSDKTFWPVCDMEDRDNCFDMGLKTLVIGGKVSRASPYSREVYYGAD